MTDSKYVVSEEKAPAGVDLIPRKAGHLPAGFNLETQAAHPSPVYDFHGTMGPDGSLYSIESDTMSISDSQLDPTREARHLRLGPSNPPCSGPSVSQPRLSGYHNPVTSSYIPQSYSTEKSHPNGQPPYVIGPPRPHHTPEASHASPQHESLINGPIESQHMANIYGPVGVPKTGRVYGPPGAPQVEGPPQLFRSPNYPMPIVSLPPPQKLDSLISAPELPQHLQPLMQNQATPVAHPLPSPAPSQLVPSQHHRPPRYPSVHPGYHYILEDCPPKPWSLETYNASKWRFKFDSISKSHDGLKREKLRAMLIHIMLDTVEACVRQEYPGEGGKLRELFRQTAGETSTSLSLMSLNTAVRERPSGFQRIAPDILVVNADSFDVGLECQGLGLKTCVLNMGNPDRPGGGYKSGAGAQEESLFRRSNLYSRLCSEHEVWSVERLATGPRGLERVSPSEAIYPLQHVTEKTTIYTPKVIVFRENEHKGYAFMDVPTTLDVLTACAISSNKHTHQLSKELLETTEEIIRSILLRAWYEKQDCVVLGALGCGAFRNPPAQIAQAFHKVLREEEYANLFKLIVFAIIEDHNSSNGNLQPFVEQFKSKALSLPQLQKKALQSIKK